MNVRVKKSEKNPETTEILAEAIVRISKAFKALQKSGLNEEAIVILIQAQTRLPRRDIANVLRALKRLRGWYCRKDYAS